MSSMPDNGATKRSLILAGGGLKVAFQAGVLQVWLDEAGIEFDHVDGASGGVFNLAMYCQGMTGTEIANNWRGLPILKGISPNWIQYFKLIFAESLMKYDRWRKNILTLWGLDWGKIQQSGIDATFNLYNFSTHRLEVRAPGEMDEDMLIAGVSLPMWFPPVRKNNNIYIDAVYLSDANLMEAVGRGASELWIIWTVSEASQWKNGFIANYFQVIETSANGHLYADIARIEKNNRAMAEDGDGEFGRHIEIKILRAKVPLHYLINFSSKRFTRAVDLGVEAARQWCLDQGIRLHNEAENLASLENTPVSLEFTEEMKGHLSSKTDDYLNGAHSDEKWHLLVHLVIHIANVDKFIMHTDHTATVTGYILCDHYGGKLSVEKGLFNLFVDAEEKSSKKMHYRLYFKDTGGNKLTLVGFKNIHDDPSFDVWSDTTTLYTKVLDGHVIPENDNEAAVYAAGIIKIHFMDFLKQLTTFRTEGSTLRARTRAFIQFGKFFMGSLWEVYRERVKVKT